MNDTEKFLERLAAGRFHSSDVPKLVRMYRDQEFVIAGQQGLLASRLAEAEQRGFARGETRTLQWAQAWLRGNGYSEKEIGEFVLYVRQLTMPPEQKEAAVELYDGDTGTISIVGKP